MILRSDIVCGDSLVFASSDCLFVYSLYGVTVTGLTKLALILLLSN